MSQNNDDSVFNIMAVVIVVLVIIAAVLFYQKSDLEKNMKDLTLAKQQLDATILDLKNKYDTGNSNITRLNNVIADKQKIIDDTVNVFNAYKATNEALINNMKQPSYILGQAVLLLNGSADSVMDALITYHTNANNSSELTSILKTYYAGIKALFHNQDSMYETMKAGVITQINRSKGQAVAMLVALCNQPEDTMLKNIHDMIVGTYTVCKPAQQTVKPAVITPTIATPVVTSSIGGSVMAVTTSPTTSLINQTVPYEPTQVCEQVPAVPYTMPSDFIVEPDGYYNMNGILSNQIGFNPYGTESGMQQVAMVIMFVDAFKKSLRKICGQPINANTIINIVTGLMDEVYVQVKFLRNASLLSMDNLVTTHYNHYYQ